MQRLALDILQSSLHTSDLPSMTHLAKDVIYPPLDPSLYRLDEQEATSYKSMTGIQDEAELKEHILRVQAKAYQVSFKAPNITMGIDYFSSLWNL